MLLIDSSGSVTQTHFEKMLSFAAYLCRLIGINNGKTRVGLITFNSHAKIAFHLEDHHTLTTVSKSIMSVPYVPGKTNMAAAIRRMREEMFERARGDRPGVPNIGVMLADGFSTIDPEQTVVEAERAHRKGIQLFTVGVGLEDFDELNLIARNEKHVFAAEDFDALFDIALDLRDSMCKGMYILKSKICEARI